MASSISRIKDQIERLQKQAEAIQHEAIVRIRKEIAELDLTPEHLFGTEPPRKVVKAKSAAKAAFAKFADDAGNTWGGIGKRPDWLRQALAAGKSLEDFLVHKPSEAAGAAKTSKAAKTAKAAPKKAAARKKPAAKNVAATVATKPKAKKAATKKAAVAKPIAKKATSRKAKAQVAATEAAAT